LGGGARSSGVAEGRWPHEGAGSYGGWTGARYRLAQLITNFAPHPLFRLRQSRFPISFAPWLAQCALSHFTSSARPTSVDVMSAIGGTVVKVGHHPIVTTKRRASSAAFKCSISSNMPLTTTPFLNAMKPRWTPWPQHADLTPGKKPIHGSHPSVFCS